MMQEVGAGPHVVSDSVRRITREESYSRNPGPAIPGGSLHAVVSGSEHTLCGLPSAALHHWPALTFPRAFGAHCPACCTAAAADGGGPTLAR